MLARYVSVVGGATLPFLLYAALAVILTPALVEGWPRASRWRLASALTGTVGAIVFATLRTLAIISSRRAVNTPTLIACVIVDVLLLVVLAILTFRPSLGERDRLRSLTQVIGCIAIAMAFFRAIPEIILQLTAFIEPGESTFSTEMLLRVLGFLGGWAGVAILAFIYYRSARRSPKVLTRVSLLVFTLVFTFVHVLELMAVLQSTRQVELGDLAFDIMTWGLNNAQGVIRSDSEMTQKSCPTGEPSSAAPRWSEVRDPMSTRMSGSGPRQRVQLSSQQITPQQQEGQTQGRGTRGSR